MARPRPVIVPVVVTLSEAEVQRFAVSHGIGIAETVEVAHVGEWSVKVTVVNGKVCSYSSYLDGERWGITVRTYKEAMDFIAEFAYTL